MMRQHSRRLIHFFIILGAIGVIFGVLQMVFGFSRVLKNSQQPKTIHGLAEKKVLFISSFSPSFELYPIQLKGIGEIFNQEQINYDIENLDARNFNTLENKQKFHSLLEYKQRNGRNYDIYMVAGDYALEYVLEYYDDYYNCKPVVFFGVNNYDLAEKAAQKENITGYFQKFQWEETIKLIKKIHPNLRELVYITDNSLTGNGKKNEFLKDAKKFDNLELTELNVSDFTKYDFAEHLKNLPLDSVLCYLQISKDSEGNVYSATEISRFLTEFSPVMVYKCSVGGMGVGIFGGMMFDFENESELAAGLCCDILRGKEVKEIPLVDATKSKAVINSLAIKKYGLDLSLIPKGTKFYNPDDLEIGDLQYVLVPSLLMIFALGFLILVAYNGYSVAEKNENSLRDTQNEIIYRAEHDSLTELSTRFVIAEKLEAFLIERAKVSVILVDLDDFKNINDFYSHAFGDAVLKEVASRFLALNNEGKYIISRFGGDEFLLVYTDGILKENSNEMDRVKSVFAAPVKFEGKSIHISVCMGVSTSSQERIYTADELIANADIAMYEAKKRGKGICSFYNESMKEGKKEINEILQILEDAIINDGFKVLYQPQVNAETGEIYGYEALVRLKDHPIPPSRFIPVAENSGLIIQLDRIVTEQVVKQLALWREHGMELHKVSINYSYGQSSDKEYILFLKNLLTKYDIEPKYIGIEITESLFIDNKNVAKEIFDSFTEMGVSLSLDDFGTGYSSLSYLTYLPVETVKIDKSLVDNYLNDEKNCIFMMNLVRLVHSLGMKLTVEGVEYQWQLDKLKSFNADYIQGYYYSKPISGVDIEQFKIAM